MAGMNGVANNVLDPVIEAVCVLPTCGGNVRLRPTDHALTPLGGRVGLPARRSGSLIVGW